MSRYCAWSSQVDRPISQMVGVRFRVDPRVPEVLPDAHDERAALGVPADEASGERIAASRGKQRHGRSFRELHDAPVLLDDARGAAMAADYDEVGRTRRPWPGRPVAPTSGRAAALASSPTPTWTCGDLEDHGDVAVSLGVEGHHDAATLGARGGQAVRVRAREPRAVERGHDEHVVRDSDYHPADGHRGFANEPSGPQATSPPRARAAARYRCDRVAYSSRSNALLSFEGGLRN